MPNEATPPAAPGTAGRNKRNLATAAVLVILGIGFGWVVWIVKGPVSAQQYLSCYLIELSLSIDNVFVFALVFRHFDLAAAEQRRLLFWGLAGAVVLRTVFIVAGIGVISRFAWIAPLLGAVIVVTGARLAFSGAMRREPDPVAGPIGRYVTRHATKAVAALVILEAADLVFALDSLPAVIAVTRDSFVAISSNLFAILGLRSLFLVVNAEMQRLRYLKAGLAAVLVFVGAKMLAAPWYPVSTGASLAVIVLILAIAAGASLGRRGQGAGT